MYIYVCVDVYSRTYIHVYIREFLPYTLRYNNCNMNSKQDKQSKDFGECEDCLRPNVDYWKCESCDADRK
jgi:hypothetical protein